MKVSRALYGASLLLGGVLLVCRANAMTFQDTVNVQFSFDTSLGITLSSRNIVISELSPGSAAYSNTITATVSTNNAYGYTLSAMVGGTGQTAANNTLYSSVTGTSFASLASDADITLANFQDNNWGYTTAGSIDNSTTYSGLIYNTGKTINKTTDYMGSPADGYVGTESTSFTIGAKAAPTQASGDYSNVITFAVVSNAMPVRTIADAGTMQNVSSKALGGCPETLTTGQAYTLTDSRDGTEYKVARALDGECWMIQNLKLGKTTSTLNLTNVESNTDAGGFILDGKLSDGIFTHTEDYQNDSSQYYCTDDYGCYYDWYTATAGSGATAITSGSVDYSICPKGWTLPTGGDGGQFDALYSNYNSTALMLVDNPTTAKENIAGKVPGFLLGGYYGPNGAKYVSYFGFYWSRTASSDRTAYLLVLGDIVNTTDESYKYIGNSVRCVLQ